jgi:flagellar motor switch protein FliG
MKGAQPTRSGTERAAILLVTLGEQEAAQVLRYMSAKEVHRIGTAMANLSDVSPQEVQSIVEQFALSAEGKTSVGVGTDEFLRKVLVDALGQDKASSIIDHIDIGRKSKGLEALKWMDARAVAELIRAEHPQIIAIVLAYLDADQSAEILGHLPEGIRSDILVRIATLDGVQPSALSELDDIMEKQFAGKVGGKTSIMGGAQAAANIINLLEASQESAVMEQIAKVDQVLSARIQDLIFVFENLIDLDDRGMQELMREVPSDKLLLALKGTDEPLKEKIFKNMSQRAAEMLKDDLEAKGPVRLTEVESAQREILDTARRLADEGKIALGGKGDEYV